MGYWDGQSPMRTETKRLSVLVPTTLTGISTEVMSLGGRKGNAGAGRACAVGTAF